MSRSETSTTALTGQVVTTDGWPVTEAAVTAVTTVGGQAGRSGTGSDGSFVLQALAPGTYTVIVSAPGHEPRARTVAVAPDGPNTLGMLTLRRAARATLPAPGTWIVDPMHSHIHVSVTHLGLTTIRGSIREFTGQIVIADPIERSSVDVSMDPASVDTGNTDRDNHLRSTDFLDVLRFPAIEFTSNGLTRDADQVWRLGGTLVMKGESQPVTLRVTYLGTGPDLWGGTRSGFAAATDLSRDDFAMTWNQAVLPGVGAVGRTLHIDLDIQAVRQ